LSTLVYVSNKSNRVSQLLSDFDNELLS